MAYPSIPNAVITLTDIVLTPTFWLSIAASWLGSLLLFPVCHFQQWVNSRLVALWRLICMKKGLTGRWLAVYSMNNSPSSLRYELAHIYQLGGGEIRGKIADESTKHKYHFVGRRIANEIIAHYWLNDESEDIGAIRLTLDAYYNRADGSLIVYDSAVKRISSDIKYSLRRLPPFWQIMSFTTVRSSTIHNRGVFSLKRFSEGDTIGRIRLGKELEQGTHTIAIKGRHYDTNPPYRFLNHSCAPNAEVRYRDGKKLDVVAISDILPQDEITINYQSLKESISNEIKECQCPQCKRQRGVS
ncbi:MAG: SET domain-containing protein [Deltaproteobacteria bacterium]|nr:SET domain-containing protein [Deltaproteobacteria bacterium]